MKDIRHKVVIATKCGITMIDGKRTLDARPETIKRTLNESLKRLQTDYVDLYYLHSIDPNTQIETVAKTMKELYLEGKIKAWGISQVDEETLRRAHKVFPVSTIQNRYSMMARDEEKIFDTCKELGVTFVAFSPMANGFLTGTYHGEKIKEDQSDFRNLMPQFTKEGYEKSQELLSYLHQLADEKHATMGQISFLDPTVTYSVNQYQTACGSADILSHVMEQYFNMDQDLYMLDCFMEELMKTVIKYAPIAMKEPDNYEARANLMWASSWAINGFITGGKLQAWSCHSMEHELSAFYDITHGLGLAILTPCWIEYCLNEKTVSKYVQFGVYVFGIDESLEPMEIAKESINRLSTFLYDTLGLKSHFKDIGIDDKNFSIMAKKACGDTTLKGFIPLNQKDIENIFQMCM